jgi:hypothetical protein
MQWLINDMNQPVFGMKLPTGITQAYKYFSLGLECRPFFIWLRNGVNRIVSGDLKIFCCRKPNEPMR